MQAFFELARDENTAFCCEKSTNNECQPHFHSNIEIAFVIKGGFEATISGQTALLRPGDLSVASSYEVHHYRTPKESEIVLLIIPTNLVSRFNLLAQHSVFKTPFLIGSRRSDAIYEAIRRLEEFNGTNDSIIVKGYLYAILGYLIEQLGLRDYSGSASDLGPVRDILMYIEEHYLEPLTVTQLAAHFGYNKYYFSRLFNRTLGCGFNHYVNTIRARHAASLIHNSDLSITEIGFASGFNNARTFARAFQTLYGVTALEYKKGRIPPSDMDREIIKFRALKEDTASDKKQ